MNGFIGFCIFVIGTGLAIAAGFIGWFLLKASVLAGLTWAVGMECFLGLSLFGIAFFVFGVAITLAFSIMDD